MNNSILISKNALVSFNLFGLYSFGYMRENLKSNKNMAYGAYINFSLNKSNNNKNEINGIVLMGTYKKFNYYLGPSLIFHFERYKYSTTNYISTYFETSKGIGIYNSLSFDFTKNISLMTEINLSKIDKKTESINETNGYKLIQNFYPFKMDKTFSLTIKIKL